MNDTSPVVEVRAGVCACVVSVFVVACSLLDALRKKRGGGIRARTHASRAHSDTRSCSHRSSRKPENYGKSALKRMLTYADRSLYADVC